MTTKFKIEHTRTLPEENEPCRWKSLAEAMNPGDHVTCNNRNEMQSLANALANLGRVPRTHRKTFTVFRRL